jgi:hypothetical protein
MAAVSPLQADGPDAPPFPGEALIDEMERVPEPALLYLSGGRIAAVNRAAARLSEIRAVGMTIGELLDRYGAKRPDGGRLNRGDLPYARALRGEVVAQGERIDMTLPGGSVYRALVTSAPVVVNGKVVAALSVWHDFDAYVRRLASSPPLPKGPAAGKPARSGATAEASSNPREEAGRHPGGAVRPSWRRGEGGGRLRGCRRTGPRPRSRSFRWR